MIERLTLIHYGWCKKRKFEHRVNTHGRKVMCKDIGKDGYLQAKERGMELDPFLRAEGSEKEPLLPALRF